MQQSLLFQINKQRNLISAPANKNHKGNDFVFKNDILEYLSDLNHSLIILYIYISFSVKTGSDSLPVNALIDSGASTNYGRLADWVKSNQKSYDGKLHNCKLP